MMTLANIRDWLKTLDIAEHYYIGRLDDKQEKSIGVYTLKRSTSPVTAIGTTSTYDIIGLSLLLHWTDNANETEIAARSLYDYLRSAKNLNIDDTEVYMIELLVPEPIDVGADEANGVYERVIEFNLYYERK